MELAELELGVEVNDRDDEEDALEDESVEVDDTDEDEVDGRDEKESETLGLATLQNCWASDSADARSLTHCPETQLVMSRTKRVALHIPSLSVIDRHASWIGNSLAAEAVHISNAVTAHLGYGNVQAIRHCQARKGVISEVLRK